MATKAGKDRGARPARKPRRADSQVGKPLISEARLRRIYFTMLKCRVLDENVRRLRGRSDYAAYYRPSRGSEAVAAGVLIDLRADDWVVPLPGDLAARFIRNAPLKDIFAPSGPRPLRLAPPPSTPAAQLTLAAGIALGLKAKKSGSVVVAMCGRMPSSGRAWSEALHFAGIHCLPVVVVVQTRASGRAGARRPESLVPDLRDCGFPAIPVDADDAVAIYRVAHEAVHKARHGGGPTLIEATEFRGPAGARVRPPASIDAIAKMEAYLVSKGLYVSAKKQTMQDEFQRQVSSAIASAGAAPPDAGLSTRPED